MRIRQDTCIKVLGRQVGAERKEVMAAPSSDGLGRREEVSAGSCGHYSTNRQVFKFSPNTVCFCEYASRMDFDLDFVTCVTPLPLCKSPWMTVIRMNPVYSVFLAFCRVLDFSQAASLLCGYWSQPCLMLRSHVCYPQCPVPLKVSFLGAVPTLSDQASRSI